MTIMTAWNDQEILAHHSIQDRARGAIELRIVNKLIETANLAGYDLVLDDADDWDDCTRLSLVGPSAFKTCIFDGGFSVHIFVMKDEEDPVGSWVKLVLGNEGYDLISDYTKNLEEFLAPLEDFPSPY